MKKIILVLLILALVSCKKENNCSVVTGKYTSHDGSGIDGVQFFLTTKNGTVQVGLVQYDQTKIGQTYCQ